LKRPEEEQVNYDDKEVLVIEGEPEEEEKEAVSTSQPSLLYCNELSLCLLSSY